MSIFRQLILLLLLWDHDVMLPSSLISNSSNKVVDGQKTASSSSVAKATIHRTTTQITFQGLQEHVQLVLYEKHIQKIRRSSSALPYVPGNINARVDRRPSRRQHLIWPRTDADIVPVPAPAPAPSSISIAPALTSSHYYSPNDAFPNYPVSTATSRAAAAVAPQRGGQTQLSRLQKQQVTYQVTVKPGDDYETIVEKTAQQAQLHALSMIQNDSKFSSDDRKTLMKEIKQEVERQLQAMVQNGQLTLLKD
jgi:hypothetical protein